MSKRRKHKKKWWETPRTRPSHHRNPQLNCKYDRSDTDYLSTYQLGWWGRKTSPYKKDNIPQAHCQDKYAEWGGEWHVCNSIKGSPDCAGCSDDSVHYSVEERGEVGRVRKLKDKIKKIIRNKIRVNPERNTRILKRLLNVNFCEDYNFFLWK